MRFCLVGEVYVVAKTSVVGYFSEPIVAASHVFRCGYGTRLFVGRSYIQ